MGKTVIGKGLKRASCMNILEFVYDEVLNRGMLKRHKSTHNNFSGNEGVTPRYPAEREPFS